MPRLGRVPEDTCMVLGVSELTRIDEPAKRVFSDLKIYPQWTRIYPVVKLC